MIAAKNQNTNLKYNFTNPASTNPAGTHLQPSWNSAATQLELQTYGSFEYCIEHFQFYLHQGNLVLLHNHFVDEDILVLLFSCQHHTFSSTLNSAPIHPNVDDTIVPYRHIFCVVLKLKISKNQKF